MTPSVKNIVGLSMMTASILATAAWGYTSFRAKELVGSPFVWAAFVIAYFWGVFLLPPLQPEADEATKKALRKKLIFVFLGMATIIGLLFLLAHILLGDPTRSSQSYAPWSVVTTLVAYAWYYYYRGRPAGAGGVIAPIVFFFGIAFSPILFLEIFISSTEEVEALPSPRSIPTARSNYVSFRDPEVVPEKALVWTYHTSRNQNHNASFTALIPVRSGRTDTLFDTWVAMNKEEYWYLSLGDSVIGRKERVFYAYCRARAMNFPYDSVVFYNKGRQNHRHVLEKKNYPIQADAIVVEPVFEPLDEYASSQRYSFLGIFALVTLFFWVATAWYDPEKGR